MKDPKALYWFCIYTDLSPILNVAISQTECSTHSLSTTPASTSFGGDMKNNYKRTELECSYSTWNLIRTQWPSPWLTKNAMESWSNYERSGFMIASHPKGDSLCHYMIHQDHFLKRLEFNLQVSYPSMYQAQSYLVCENWDNHSPRWYLTTGFDDESHLPLLHCMGKLRTWCTSVSVLSVRKFLHCKGTVYVAAKMYWFGIFCWWWREPPSCPGYQNSTASE